MFGEKALELLRELKRAREGTLPPYAEDTVRQVSKPATVEEYTLRFEDGHRSAILAHVRCA